MNKSELESRLQNLEMRFTYQERFLDELNVIITDQQKQIERLVNQVKHLTEKQNRLPDHSEEITNPPPPHY